MMHKHILMYRPRAVVADIDNIRLMHINRGTQLNAATCIVPVERLRDLNGLSVVLTLILRWLYYQYVEGTVRSDGICLLV